MKRKLLVPLLLVAVLAALAEPALAGGNINKAKSEIESALGVKFRMPIPADARVGQSFDAAVVDPSRLARFGIPGIQKNQVVTLKLVGANNDFDVIHGPSGLTKGFSLNSQGVVSPRLAAPPASPQAPGAQTK